MLMYTRVILKSITLLILLLLAATGPAPRAQEVGQKGLRSVGVKELPAKSKRWALIIGVSKYEQGANFQELVGPDNDARGLKDALIKYAGFPDYQVFVMTTDAADPKMRPTRANVINRLGDITNKLDKDGLFLFAFSGHGMITPDGEGVLAAQDTHCLPNSSYLRANGVPVADIQNIINESGVKQRIILLDACRNNPMPGAKGAGDHNPMSDGFRLDEANRNVDAYVTLYATRKGSEAYENLKRGHGYFMEAVVEALTGKAGYDPKTGGVTLGRLLSYVESIVKERTIREGTPSVQEPFHSDNGRLSQDLVLAYVASANPEAVAEEEWDKIRGSEDPAAFKEYERKYPGSKYAEEAAWSVVRKSGNWQEFKSYLGKYPRSAHAEDARFRADQLFWEEVDRAKSLTSYKGYLNEYPKGLHAPEAAFQIEEIVWNQAQKAADYNSYLSVYPAGRYAATAKLLMQPPASPTIITAPPVPVLSVFTSPPVPNARVVITSKAGKPIEGRIDATGAYSTELPIGVYDIEVSAAKYKAEPKSGLRVDRSGAVTIEMTPTTGSILIGPVAPDVNVYLNGQKQTNLRRSEGNDKAVEVFDVPVGRYKLRVVQTQENRSDAEIRAEVERDVEVIGGKQLSVFTELPAPRRLAGTVTIETAPDSELYLDGSYKGRANGQGLARIDDVPVGPHYVEVKNVRYKELRSPTFSVAAGQNTPLKLLNLTPIVADASPWYDRFENLDNWDAAKTWRLGWNGKKNVLIAGVELGLENRSDYDDLEAEFDVNIVRGNRAAWALRAINTKTYYFFVLEKGKERATLYAYWVKDGQLGRRRIVGDFFGALPPQFHIYVVARGGEVKTYFDKEDGSRQLLGTVSDAQEFPIGKVGFRAFAEGDEFVIMDFQCRPKR